MTERIDIHAEIAKICRSLGVEPTYVTRLDFRPGDVDVTLLKGRDGRCKGSPYLDPETDEAATEVLHFDLRTPTR